MTFIFTTDSCLLMSFQAAGGFKGADSGLEVAVFSGAAKCNANETATQAASPDSDL